MKKVSLVFPGQGSQYIGMGKDICLNSSKAKEVFREANEVLGFNMEQLCFEGDINKLTLTENTQPAILTVSVAMYKDLEERIGIKPSFLAGHSLGEITALCISGAIKFKDAVQIARNRGKFMQEAATMGVGGMCAITGVSKEVIEEICIKVSSIDNVVVISNYNSPKQIVISGHKEAVERAREKLNNIGATVVPLKVSAPFHSPLMKDAAIALREELSKYKFNDFSIPVLSNVDARPYEDKNSIIDNLTKQLVSPVQWVKTFEFLDRENMDYIIEVGPNKVLRNLTKDNSSQITAYSYDNEVDRVELEKVLGVGKKMDNEIKKVRGTVVTRCMAVAVCTKNSNWDNEEYRRGVIMPYKKIQEMQMAIEGGGNKPTLEQMYEALNMLKSVFNTKGTPISEQIERFNQIFDETETRELLSDFKIPSM
ncbi:ACP S-malonyltransferase [Clostridium sp. LP20]|uniref:ACP S-malonyltransferase n=1 Tax=Clostridium sp. LP20 TaxID=3418665 RepID=UPI003EE6980E